jgi:hypothetical protein
MGFDEKVVNMGKILTSAPSPVKRECMSSASDSVILGRRAVARRKELVHA